MIQSHPLCQPLLFVSHRWQTAGHPDPEGEQLRMLQEGLNNRDCYVLYDYLSFPQHPRTEDERVAFGQILQNMNWLIRNVIILPGAPDYLERAWCLYEYMVASMNNTLVLDPLQDAALTELRHWNATPRRNDLRYTSYNSSGYVSSAEALERQEQNYLNQQILRAASQVLPLFGQAKVTSGKDKETVIGLVLEHLKRALPRKMKLTGGRWHGEDWTERELREMLSVDGSPATSSVDDKSLLAALSSSEEDLPTHQVQPHRAVVPHRLEDAAQLQFVLDTECENTMDLYDRGYPYNDLSSSGPAAALSDEDIAQFLKRVEAGDG